MIKYCIIYTLRILSHAMIINVSVIMYLCLETCHIKCITLDPEDKRSLLAHALCYLYWKYIARYVHTSLMLMNFAGLVFF